VSVPESFDLTAVQAWVCRELKYSGRKEEMANTATERALEWWIRKGDPKYTYGLQQETLRSSAKDRWRKDAYKECKAYVHETPQRYGFIWSILLSLMMNIIISAVANLIIKWLFSDEKPRLYYATEAERYRESVVDDAQ